MKRPTDGLSNVALVDDDGDGDVDGCGEDALSCVSVSFSMGQTNVSSSSIECDIARTPGKRDLSIYRHPLHGIVLLRTSLFICVVV